ncbi:hypothetical protein JTB14_026897 [Gonioctena quinquepunctata]|nr:hypothetical protein JTB14_026897 [Gonioctena quinquepunctata]
MHFVYDRSNGNGRQARRLYAELYLGRRVLHHTIFARFHQSLRENGTFRKQTADCGHPPEVRTVQLEEAVLELIAKSPESSTRKIANKLNVSNFTVFKILEEQQLYPFHIQHVQALLPRDFFPRLVFCHWILHQIARVPNFLNGVWFTHEANFERQCIRNFHNNHLWAEENPYGISEAHFQHQFSVYVWLGVLDDHLIGPYFLLHRLTGDSYPNFLQEEVPVLLEEIPLQLRQHFWFMHDGAPVHFSIIVRNHLDTVNPNRWIGRRGTEHWPARSPDLNPLDVEDLRNRIIAGCETIRNKPGKFARIRQSMRRRIEFCLTSEGGNFEHLL